MERFVGYVQVVWKNVLAKASITGALSRVEN
jgi:hypothetical protein